MAELDVSEINWVLEDLPTILREWGYKYSSEGRKPTMVDYFIDTKANKVVYRLFFTKPSRIDVPK